MYGMKPRVYVETTIISYLMDPRVVIWYSRLISR
jgi:hypothetical protein